MYKFMILSNYKYVEHTKYGDCYIMNGLLYNNIDSKVVGHQNYTVWAYKNHPMRALCKKENLGKDIYIMFGPEGRVIQCEVR